MILLYDNIFPVKLIHRTNHLEDIKPNNLSVLSGGKVQHGLKIHMNIINIWIFLCKKMNEDDVEKAKLKSSKLLMNTDENLENICY